jgi:inner membrane protein
LWPGRSSLDSLTHIALGAVIGDTLVSKQVGKRALFIGAAAQSIPDIDFIAGLWLDTDNNLLAHRGFTHSILFIIVVSFLCAFAAGKLFRDAGISPRQWLILFLLETSCHLVLDTMNAYGVGLFEPFFDHRYSFNVLFVADPFFSVAPGMAALALLLMGRHDTRRPTWQTIGWSVSATYVVVAIIIKVYLLGTVSGDLAANERSNSRYFITPTPMNILLWYIVVEEDGGYFIGYRSVFDRSPTAFHFVARNEELLAPIADREDVQNLIRFSNDYYVVSSQNDTLTFSDMRFGQVFGWLRPDAPFVFNYNLKYPDNNEIVIQRGRFRDWNARNVRLSMRRMKGK